MLSAVKAEAQNVRHLAVTATAAVTDTVTITDAVDINTTRHSATPLPVHWCPVSRYDMSLFLSRIALPSSQ